MRGAGSNPRPYRDQFATDDDEGSQRERGLLLVYPMCGDADVQRLPSAPRLNLGAARPAETLALPAPGDLQAQWLRAMRQMMEQTEDVGERFAEEARRIHYGVVTQRGIRGQATASDAQELRDEGIEVLALRLPSA